MLRGANITIFRNERDIEFTSKFLIRNIIKFDYLWNTHLYIYNSISDSNSNLFWKNQSILEHHKLFIRYRTILLLNFQMKARKIKHSREVPNFKNKLLYSDEWNKLCIFNICISVPLEILVKSSKSLENYYLLKFGHGYG